MKYSFIVKVSALRMCNSLVYILLLFTVNLVKSHNPHEDPFRTDETFTDAEDNPSGQLYGEELFQDDDNKLHGSSCSRHHHTCKLSLPNTHQPAGCKTKRLRNIQLARIYYTLTKLGRKNTIRFPLRSIPFLNQTMDEVKFRAALDPVDSLWLAKLGVFTGAIEKFTKQSAQRFAQRPFTDERDYISAFDMHNMQLEHLKVPQYFSNPAQSPTFTDVIHNGRYKSDEVFVQQRLAGPCPFMIKRVTTKRHGLKWCELEKLLNPNYDFDAAISSALNERFTLEQAVCRGRLYVLYHPENNGIQTIPDYFDRNLTDDHYLFNMTSPIALFVTTRSGDLKVAAIQEDYVNTSPVYTPNSDSFRWSLAKSMVNLGDMNICQAMWHLSHVHISGSVYCTIYKSHFSSSHPLHEVMKYHCEGTTPHISLTYGLLVAPNQLGRKLFSFGNTGFVNLTVTGHKKFRYGLLAYDELLRSHGLKSRNIKYHPFRDDGLVIWKGLKRFASEFVRQYYKHDADVRADGELQSFADQVSIDGVGDSYGGKGNIVGFPSFFRSRRELKKFVTRFLWQIAMHATINYPLEPWATFVPLLPTKLYHNDNLRKTKNLFSALPDAPTTLGVISFAESVGNFRVNRMFDYHDKVRDAKLGKLVRKYYYEFHDCIQKRLAARNKERKSKNLMGFQYLEPKWLTNSIHV